MKEKIRLEILGLTYNQLHAGAYTLILGEVDGERKIPIIIGQTEAQAIAIQLQQVETPRPLTHDLTFQIMKKFQIDLREVFIYKVVKNVYFSELLCWKEGEKTEKIDARTSDAIALAVRYNCPIYIDKDILDSLVFNKEGKEEKKDIPLEELSTEKLKDMLEQSIMEENFEFSSVIRDEINKRKKE